MSDHKTTLLTCREACFRPVSGVLPSPSWPSFVVHSKVDFRVFFAHNDTWICRFRDKMGGSSMECGSDKGRGDPGSIVVALLVFLLFSAGLHSRGVFFLSFGGGTVPRKWGVWHVKLS